MTNELQQVLAETIPVHEIIKTDYMEGLSKGDWWPRWNCRCGGSGYVPVGWYKPLEEAQRDCWREGNAHVINGNKAEAMKARTNGAFSF